MLNLFFATLASLFTVVNPLGAVPVFLALSGEHTAAERRGIARLTSLWFFMILAGFFLAGSLILNFFGLELNALRIAGGLIILNSGYGLLNAQTSRSGNRRISKKVEEEAQHKGDISFTPLAMPLLSGPGSISLLIGLFAEQPEWASRGVILGVIATMAVIVYLIFASAPYLFKLLGESGLAAMSRIMGFLVMSIGIQYIIYGILSLAETIMQNN
jgi:multiple antibiotic resistance protein